MKLGTSIMITITVALLSFSIQAQKYDDPFHFELLKLQDDIYVAYRPNPLRYLVEGNCTIIINDNDVVVVDATGSPQGAKEVIAAIKQLTN